MMQKEQGRNPANLQLFLTCADHELEHVSRDICLWLRDTKFQVTAEFDSSKMMGLNKNEWFGEALKSDFILICIDKNYQNAACGYIPTDISDDERKSEAQYVFDYMQTEIMHNGCLNSRYIPILIADATTDDIPTILRNSKSYRWPNDKRSLLDRLTGRMQFSPPPIGSPVIAEFQPVT